MHQTVEAQATIELSRLLYQGRVMLQEAALLGRAVRTLDLTLTVRTLEKLRAANSVWQQQGKTTDDVLKQWIAEISARPPARRPQ